MPGDYAHYQFQLEVLSPVAAESPFDSDTLWGRVVCALMEGAPAERTLAEGWVAELRKTDGKPDSGWQPPLIASEGFQCDRRDHPWLPIPLAVRRKWEADGQKKHKLPRKEIKKLDHIPLETFFDLCEGKEADLHQLKEVCTDTPRTVPSLQPHLAMDRLSGAAIEGMLHMMPLRVYRAGPEEREPKEPFQKAHAHTEPPPHICFFLKILRDVDSTLIQGALKRVCREGWGHAKSRGMGRTQFVSFQPWQPKRFEGTPNGFVSLSHFCPAAIDPTGGYWKIKAKHPVPAQFVDGQRIVLGEGKGWRVRSFLRLTPGSCFQFGEGKILQACYGRMISGEDLLKPSMPGDPAIFHYALAYPWPICWPVADQTAAQDS